MLMVSALAFSACAPSSGGQQGDGNSGSPAGEPTWDVFAAPSVGGMVPVTKDGDTVSIEVVGGQVVEIDTATKPKVAFASMGQGNSFTATSVKAAQDAADFYGYDLTVFDAGFDASKQRDQIETIINSGDYPLLMVQMMNVSSCLGKEAAAAGIVTTLVNVSDCNGSNLPNDQMLADGYMNGVFGSATAAAYRTFAERVIADTKSPSKAIVIAGPIGQPASDMMVGELQKQSAGSDLEIVAVARDEQGSYQYGLTAAEALLTANPDVNVVIADFSETTEGALEAAKSLGRDDLVIYDYGANQAILDAVDAGTVRATQPYFPYTSAYVAMSSLILASQGESVPRIILNDGRPAVGDTTDPVWVTKDNIADFRKAEY